MDNEIELKFLGMMEEKKDNSIEGGGGGGYLVQTGGRGHKSFFTKVGMLVNKREGSGELSE